MDTRRAFIKPLDQLKAIGEIGTDLFEYEGVWNGLERHFVLGADIDASETAGSTDSFYNDGFIPLGRKSSRPKTPRAERMWDDRGGIGLGFALTTDESAYTAICGMRSVASAITVGANVDVETGALEAPMGSRGKCGHGHYVGVDA